MQDQGTDRNPSSSSTSNSSNGSNVRACSISVPSKPSLDLLISYLDDVLSAIIDKGPSSKRNDSEIKLKDIVQPIASDFSKLLEGISQGAKMFSDQKSSTSKLSSEVETVALDLLKGLGKAHWVAAGLLVIANVLERFDKISSNDRECTDLLRGMLDLAKVIKRLKDIHADLHKDILEKMKEAVHLVVSGAILCHSFITCNKISKFLLTTKIREELVYVRGKVDRMIRDLGIQTELTILSTLTFYMSRQQQHNDNEGGTEETRYPTEEFDLQQGNLGGVNIHCEIEEICETQTHKMEMHSDTESSLSASNGQVEDGCYKKQLPFTDNSKRKNGNQPRMFKTIARLLNKITGQIFEGRERSVQSDWDWVIAQNFRDLEWKNTTSGFKSPPEAGNYRGVYKGMLNDGRQVGVKIAPNGLREEIYRLIKDLVFTRYLHHRNIMKTHGFCIDRRGLMLVCEYVPNGTLSDILFDPIKKLFLDWRRRFNVILEVIRALAYLHEGVDVGIVHRDITPANILLDSNLRARISNFEFAIVLQDNMDDPEVAGTDGYIAPECRLTEKADIYSFGILLLNLVSGKKVIETVDNGLYILWKQALMLHKENRLIELIDPDLVNGQGFDSGDILRATMIALLCIQEDPDLRPPASRVSVMLSTKEVEIPTATVQLPLELNNVYYSTLPTMSRTIIGHSFPSSQVDFSIQELEIATNGIQCKLGEGRFGCVSKGILANGRQVVVKRARKETTGFMNELKSIAKLHHRNILELVGFCSESEELMLVYDYMPNGTLSDFLFDPIKKQVLDWRRRFNVILEVISALAYVHERAGADKRIVHRDIKPANILLDENFSARISDFTLAVALQNNMDESTPLAGTLGYIAPECIVGGHVTEKADIYSFGILVLNVVSGKTCLEFTSLDDGLHNLVERELYQEENGFIELIDPELVKDPGFVSGDILRAIIIALLCLQIDPDLRPPASQVLVMLSAKEMDIPTAPDNVNYAIPPELNNVYYSIPSSAIQHLSEFDCRDDIFRG